MLENDLQLLRQELELDFGELKATEYEAFRSELGSAVFYYLKNDMNRLMSFLYRIDVLEKKFKEVMNNNHPLEVNALQIADLILDRSLKKIQYRRNSDWQDC